MGRSVRERPIILETMRGERTYRRFLFCALVVMTCGVILVGSWAWIQVRQKTRYSPVVLTSVKKRSGIIEGLTITSQDGSHPRAIIKADEFGFSPGSVFGFRVRMLGEPALSKVHWRVFLDSNAGDSGDIFYLSDSLFHLGDGGKESARDSGLIIKRLSMEIFDRSQILMRITARRVRLNLTSGTARLENAIIEDVALKRSFTARYIVWNNSDKRFHIPGRYEMRSNGDTQPGRNTSVGLAIENESGPQHRLNE